MDVSAALNKSLEALKNTKVPIPGQQAAVETSRTEPTKQEAATAAAVEKVANSVADSVASRVADLEKMLAEKDSLLKKAQTDLYEFAKETKHPEAEALAGLSNKPVARSDVRKMEADVSLVGQELAQVKADLEAKVEALSIREQILGLPEYATLKDIPDLASLVQRRMVAVRQAARNRGEGEVTVSVEQVVKDMKAERIDTLKKQLANLELAQELGLVPKSEQTKSTSESRALSNSLTSSGSTTSSVKYTSDRDFMADQLRKASKLQWGS